MSEKDSRIDRIERQVRNLNERIDNLWDDMDCNTRRLDEELRRVRQATAYPPGEPPRDLPEAGAPHA
jgi:hypothetical protein